MKKLISKNLIWGILIIILSVFLFARLVWGWTNPSQNPPSGGGILYYINSKLGIGTSTPPYLVSISSSTDSLLGLFRQGGTIPTIFKQGTDNAFVINNNNADIVSIKNNNVGIGTMSPRGGGLELNGNLLIPGPSYWLGFNMYWSQSAGSWKNATGNSNLGSFAWRNADDGTGLQLFSYPGQVAPDTSISPSIKIIVTPGGNVGIGTTNPIGAKLVVNGTISASTPINDTDVATKAYVDAAGGGGTSKSVYYGSGSGNFVVPSNVTLIHITLVGGGGGARGSAYGCASGTGGGGGGGVIDKYPFNVTSGQSIAWSVGNGGAGGAAGVSGTNGQSTVFGSLTAYGGKGSTNTTSGGKGGDVSINVMGWLGEQYYSLGGNGGSSGSGGNDGRGKVYAFGGGGGAGGENYTSGGIATGYAGSGGRGGWSGWNWNGYNAPANSGMGGSGTGCGGGGYKGGDGGSGYILVEWVGQ